MDDPRLLLPTPRTCDRCGRIISRESRSYFTREVICPVCVEIELEIRSKLEKPRVYEQIGFVPEVEK